MVLCRCELSKGQRRTHSKLAGGLRSGLPACRGADYRTCGEIDNKGRHLPRSLTPAGGPVLNCASNSALLASGVASTVRIPDAGDGDLGVGAAMHGAAQNRRVGPDG